MSRKLQSKVTVRCYLKSSRTVITEKDVITSVGENADRLEPTDTTGGHGEVELLWKTIWQAPKMLNIKLLCDPAILLLSIYPR